MTNAERKRYDDIKAVVKFMESAKMDAWTLAKIAKELCSCGTCRFFIQHYTKMGIPLDWGHCCKGNIQHSKKISTSCCGYWEDDDGEE